MPSLWQCDSHLSTPIMIRLALLLAVLLVSASCTAQKPPAVPPPLLPVEAQRVIDRATETAQVMATQNAMATADRRATDQSIADMGTSTAVVLLAQQAQAEATSDQFSRNLRDTAQADQSTAQVVARALTQEYGRVQSARDAELDMTVRGVLSLLGLALAAAIVMIGLVVAKTMEGKARIQASMLIADALRRRLVETRNGTAWLSEDGVPLILPPPGPVKLVDSLYLNDDAIPFAETITVNDSHGSREVERWTNEEQAAYRDMVDLIQASIRFWIRKGKRGSHQKQVIGHRLLGWDADRWNRSRRYFGDYLVGVPGVGTFPKDDHMTLGALLHEVHSGRLQPSLPHRETETSIA